MLGMNGDSRLSSLQLVWLTSLTVTPPALQGGPALTASLLYKSHLQQLHRSW